MEAVKAFNQELSSLYEVKPPISKAKMTALTRGAIKAIKFYKHVVQSVEKFILKCKPEYKVPGLYVIDSIVRQSRHQFGPDKDVFAPRFSKNLTQTFINLFKCPAEDKSKIIRVLNLWQKNQVFSPETVQPLFDLADPNNPIYKEIGTPVQQTNGVNNNNVTAASNQVIIKGSPANQKTPTKQASLQGANENSNVTASNTLNLTDPNVIQQLQQLQRLLTKSTDSAAKPENQVHFDKKLLDFDYGEDEEEVNPSPRPPENPSNPVTSLLTNPEVLRQLQTLQNTLASAQQQEMELDKMKKLQEMKIQEDEFDKHLAQTVPNLPFASECEFRPNTTASMMSNYFNPPPPMPPPEVTQPNSGYKTSDYEMAQQEANTIFSATQIDSGNDVEVITLDHDDSRTPTPESNKYAGNKRRRSRSRSKDRGRDSRRSRRSRSRSKQRRHRSRSREKDNGVRKDKDKKEVKKDEKETERDKERKKRGLPLMKKDNLSVCSTTLWVGHLSKLVHQDDLSNTFGEFGDIVSIDLIPPRGCAFIVMHRRQDAARCLAKLKNHMLHGKAITLAWAPGKGVKGKDLKDYWEGDLGVSYIPYSKIREDIDLEMLEDGGMIDEDTMPGWMKAKVEEINSKKAKLEPPPLFHMAETSNSNSIVDTSQPPPMPGAGLLQPPLLPMVSPFQFNNRLLGMPPTMMPNIPIGVPPPNMPGAMLSNPLMGMSPFQGAPGILPPQPHLPPHMESKSTPPPPISNPEATMKSLSEALMNMTQPFGGMIPQPPPSLPSREESMDVEMEDLHGGAGDNSNGGGNRPKAIPLSEQLEQSIGGFQGSRGRNRSGERRGGGDRRDDRSRRRSRSRDNNRDRDRDNRDRGRQFSRDRDSRRDRDRDSRDGRSNRDRDRKERGNRWGPVERDSNSSNSRDRRGGDEAGHDERREREKTLNERLKEMAGMTSSSDHRDSNRDRSSTSSRRDRDRNNDDPRRRSNDGDNKPPSTKDKKEKDSQPSGTSKPPPLLDFVPPPALQKELQEERDSAKRDEVKTQPPKDENEPPKPPQASPREPRKMSEGPAPLMEERIEPPPALFRGDAPPPEDFTSDDMAPFGRDGPPFKSDGPPFDRPPFGPDGPDGPPFDGPPPFDRPPFDGPPFDRPPFGPDGPQFGPDGPPFGPDGPPFGSDGPRPKGPPFGADGPPFDSDGPRPKGPPFGPKGPPFGPKGPPFGPDGPPFGSDGPPFGLDGPFGPDGPDGPPFGSDGPPFDGPPFDRPPFDGPPFDRPPFDGPPFDRRFRGDRDFDEGPGRFDGPPERFDGPPDRFMRGRRGDFRGDDRRGGPPRDYFPPMDNFGPRGPPRMGPRGPRGQFFQGPRGPRGPRGPPFRDGPGFNPRFDGPDFFRGPRGRFPPPDERFGPRHRGPRGRRGHPDFDGPPDFFDGPGPGFDRPPFDGPGFDRPPFDGPGHGFDGPPFDGPGFDGPGPDFGPPGPGFEGPPEPGFGPPGPGFDCPGPDFGGPEPFGGPNSRHNRRNSRWGGPENEGDNDGPIIEEMQDGFQGPTAIEEGAKGGGTPLRDESADVGPPILEGNGQGQELGDFEGVMREMGGGMPDMGGDMQDMGGSMQEMGGDVQEMGGEVQEKGGAMQEEGGPSGAEPIAE